MKDRILLLALRGRDAQVIDQLLSKQGHLCTNCGNAEVLAAMLADGAGTAIVTEESMSAGDVAGLIAWIEGQPAWSDFPIILLATKRTGRRPREAAAILERLGNVVVLERPIHGETLASAVKSALRGRRRQYEAQARLLELQSAEERLTDLNATLESRIAERTEALSIANNQLMHEVAERERAQTALVQSQKMDAVGQLTGGIAHDFNNLLTVISGNLEMIQLRAADARTARLVDYARQASDRAAKLTHQLLAFSRTQQLSPKPVDLNALVRGMNNLLVRTIGPQIRIEMHLDPCAPWAMTDENQLELAILNLAINARDAMADTGVLTITSGVEELSGPARSGVFGTISVSDTGSGIPAHLMTKVFDPFFTTKPKGKGTGLGLSQVFGIAEQSGGTVEIESRETFGTTVAILLPLTERVAVREQEAPSAPGDESPQGRVLVIDDDNGVRRFIVECLESLGYDVVEAATGVSGLEILSATKPDLLIVDFAMPGMNGVEVVEEVRVRAPEVSVILATGYADTKAVDRVTDITQVLRKPFRIADLESAVRSAFSNRDRRPV